MDQDRIEGIYFLSPTQKGMLLEALSSPTSGICVEQCVLHLRPTVEREVFLRAWQQLVAEQPILRTCFAWMDLEEPRQVVLRSVKVPVHEEDWSDLPEEAVEERLQRYLAEDRLRGFPLNKAPLVRLALFCARGGGSWFVWTHHHLVTDGWSVSVILSEVQRLYLALQQGRALLPPRRFYWHYLAWLEKQQMAETEAFWRRRLAGFVRPNRLGVPAEAPRALPAEPYGEQGAVLSAETTAALTRLARGHRVTMNILIQGMWALLLGRYGSETDVVFGATCSGRPPDLPGVEQIIGLFITTVPVRRLVRPEVQLWDWLSEAHGEQLRQRGHEYCSAGQIHAWSEMRSAQRLYDTLVVFDNVSTRSAAPLDLAAFVDPGQSRMVGSRTKHALTLLVSQGESVRLSLLHDRRRFADQDASRILDHLCLLASMIAASPEPSLGSLLAAIRDDELPRVAPVSRSIDRVFVPPRDPLERRVAHMCEQLLDVQPVGALDDFFESGGHSLLALRLVASLREEFGKEVPFSILLQNPTVEGLAAALRVDAAQEPWPTLVALRAQGSKRPFFCVPGAGGSVLYLHRLATHLGADRPFYGLQARGLDGLSEPQRSVEEMAMHYLDEIRAAQPRGPYLLGGHSFGGFVSFEIARRLVLGGERVALLALFDTVAPLEGFAPEPRIETEEETMRVVADMVEQLFGRGEASRRHASHGAPMEVLRRRIADARIATQSASADQIRGFLSVFTANRRTRYRPTSGCSVPTVLFRATECLQEAGGALPGSSGDPTSGWSGLCGGPVEVRWVPGDHLSMMTEPHVGALATALNRSIESIAERRDSTSAAEP